MHECFFVADVCVPIIPSQKNKSCRNHWKIKTHDIQYMFFAGVCKLLTTTVNVCILRNVRKRLRIQIHSMNKLGFTVPLSSQ